MGIEQLTRADLDDDGRPPAPSVPPADLVEFDDAFEEALFEAAVCGDVGFDDRMNYCSWPELDEFVPDGPEAGWAPADPLERLGRVGWLELRARELNREQARFLAAVREVGHAGGRVDDAGRPRPDAYAADQVGQVLRHSRAKGAWWLSVAAGVIDRLPRLYAEMAQGRLDLAKAIVFIETTRDMPRGLAMLVVAEVLPLAAGSSNTGLAEQVEIVACQLDHDWARRREQAALTRARVEWTRTRAGTGEIALRDVSAHATVAIKARVDALAGPLRQAARRAALPLGLPALRALACQRLLDGTYAGLDDDALLEVLTDELPRWHALITGPDDSGPGDGDDGPDSGPDSGPDDGGPDGPDDTPDDDSGPDDGGPDNGPAGDSGPDGPDDTPDDDAREGSDGDSDAGPESGQRIGGGDDEAGDSEGPGGGIRVDPAAPVVRAGTLELRLRVSTALGLDDLPGELPGSGPLPARSARRVLDEIRAGDTPIEWRVVLVDADGYLDHVLLARPDPPARPPCRPPSQRRARRVKGRVIVELSAPTTLFAALDPSRHPDWARLIIRVRAQLVDMEERGTQVGGPHHPATSTIEARKRFPGAALERFVRVRDRACIGPMCRGSAHDAEIDHTRDWLHHGLTVAPNLGPPCRYCHHLKHDGGWELTQPTPGTFVWRSPLGATTTVVARRVLEPPRAPASRTDGRARPVLHVRRPPRPGDTGWTDGHARLIAPTDVAHPATATPADRTMDDKPSF